MKMQQHLDYQEIKRNKIVLDGRCKGQQEASLGGGGRKSSGRINSNKQFYLTLYKSQGQSIIEV